MASNGSGAGSSVGAATLGIVLAGGQSRRMGRDKASLPYQGRTLLDHMIAVLAAVPVSRVIVSGNRPGYDHIVDAHPDAGPALAINDIIGQHGREYGRFVIVPVDMPLLQPDLLRPLLVCGGYYQHYPLPLCVTGPPRPLTAGASIKALIAAYGAPVQPLPEGADPSFANLNTPEDWKTLQTP